MADKFILNQCPRCAGTRLTPGDLVEPFEAPVWFRPAGNLAMGYSVQAFVCTDCGAITLGLPDSALRELRGRA